MKETDPYFQLMRGLLHHLASTGIIDKDAATTVISEALNAAADTGDMETVRALDALEKLMYDSAVGEPPGAANDAGPVG